MKAAFYGIIFILCIADAMAVVTGITESQKMQQADIEIKIIQIPEFDTSNVIEIFLMAVDQGELKALDTVVERNMLSPYRVELVYMLDQRQPVIKVISRVDPPIPLPNIGKACITQISVILDMRGRIMDTTVHCDF